MGGLPSLFAHVVAQTFLLQIKFTSQTLESLANDLLCETSSEWPKEHKQLNRWSSVFLVVVVVVVAVLTYARVLASNLESVRLFVFACVRPQHSRPLARERTIKPCRRKRRQIHHEGQAQSLLVRKRARQHKRPLNTCIHCVLLASCCCCCWSARARLKQQVALATCCCS